MAERQLYHRVKAIHQLYINPKHQLIYSRLFSKSKITCTIKANNKTH